LLTDCQHFALSKKNDKRNNVFKKKNLNLIVKFPKFSQIKFHENPRFSKIKKKSPENFTFFRFFRINTLYYYLPLFIIYQGWEKS